MMLFLLRLSLFIFRLPSYNIQTSGKLYIVSKISKDIQVVDLSNGEEIAEIPVDLQSYDAISTIDKHKIVLTNYGARVGNIMRVVNTKTNEVEKTIDLKGDTRTNGIVALPEANKVAVIDIVNNNLLVLNIENDSIEKKISTEQERSHLLALHPTKPLAYVTNITSGSVSVIDLNLNKVVKIIPCETGRMGIEITPDGSELWVSNTNGNSITVINTTTYEIVNTLKTGRDPLRLKFSIDGKYCFVANAKGGNVFIYNQESKEKIKTIHLHGKTTFMERLLYNTPRPVNFLMHPNGLYAFISNSNANRIEVVDMKTFDVVGTIGTGKVPDALVFIE